MATNASEDKDIIYFPIDQGEQAKQAKPEYLLARPVYERIAGFLKESLDKTASSFSSDDACLDLDEHRAHNAILLDGGRGTGKSTILVNLSTYASTVPTERTLPDKSEAKLADFLLILKPVDPTLLENDDDLFLNIIVAALLRNKEVKDATQDYEKSKTFYARLQALGTALEGTQKQKSEFGMDKLRAFIGNHSVSDEVHQLFYEALKITGKKLIVLPIDDVDTSLQHAFNNLEVVRRYLASPYVVPIISGDLDLFHEVIWRNFFEGITAKARAVEVEDAIKIAKSLADEYERKLLPVSRRNSVQNVWNHIKNTKIILPLEDENVGISLYGFVSYLNDIHNNSLNNFENSQILFNFSSIRALSQLITSLNEKLAKLIRILNEREPNGGPHFMRVTQSLRESKDTDFLKIESEIRETLIEVLHKGGYQKDLLLIHAAQDDWIEFNNSLRNPVEDVKSFFDVPLFQPLTHEESDFAFGQLVEGLRNQWKNHLRYVITDEYWLESLPDKTVMSYPLPDKGIAIPGSFQVKTKQYLFSCALLTYAQVYVSGNKGVFIFFGRLFELLVISLFKNVNYRFILRAMMHAPFYSVIGFSGTKAISVQKFNDERLREFDVQGMELQNSNRKSEEIPLLMPVIADFSQEVSSWREKYGKYWSDQPSSLLVYRVMNKFFTQLANFEEDAKRFENVNNVRDVAELGLKAFNAFCAAIGSFQIPNLPGISSESGFEYESADFEKSSLYASNIGDWNVNARYPLESAQYYAKAIFHKHPLRQWLLEAKNNS